MLAAKSSSQSVVDNILTELSRSKSQHYTDFRLQIGLKKTPSVRDNFTDHFLSRRADANPSYLVIYDGRPTVKFVLRMTPPDQRCTGLHDVEREYKIMNELYTRGFPVPKPLYLSTDEDNDYFETPFFIREYVEGWNFTDASLTSVYENGYIKEAIDISAGTKWRILKSAVETLGQLHLYSGSDILDIHDEDTDNGPGSIRSFWSWRVNLWGEMIPGALPVMPQNHEAAYFNSTRDCLQQAIFGLSRRNKKSTFQEGLVHGDFNFRNLVFDPESKKVKAVLDWEMACVGDVSCDLAEFLMCLLKPTECGCSPSTLPQEFTCEEFAGEDNMKQLVSEYIKEVACTPQKLYPHFYFAMAVACVRFAAIFLDANRVGYSGHECKRSCGLAVINLLIQAHFYFSHKYLRVQD